MKKIEYLDLELNDKETLDRAEIIMNESLQKSFTHHSGLYVGAAVFTDWRITSASNFDNQYLKENICAEKMAIIKSIEIDQKISPIEKMAIIGRERDLDIEQIVSPCGECRQIIYQTYQETGINTKIIMSNTKKSEIKIATIKELLPLSFGMGKNY